MKKETISVLKPHNGKQLKSKVNKNTTKNSVNIQKKVNPPRGGGKIKIVNIEQVNIGDQLKSVKTIKKEPANIVETNSNIVNKVKNDKKKNEPSNGKMASQIKNGSNETRAQTKPKPKINLVEKRVDSTKSKKKNKSETKTVVVKNEKIKRPAEEVETKKQKKIKVETQTIEVPKAKKIKVEKRVVEKSKKEKKIKLETNSVEESKKNKIKVGKKENKVKLEKKPKKESKKSINTEHGNLEMTTKRINDSVESILKLHALKMKTKKSLLGMESAPVYLQVTSVKIPMTPRMHIRPSLPHSLIGPLDDVALFVADVKKGRKQDYEKTVDHWEEIFRQKNVDCIKEIIPINRVKTEYSQYEMRRKLAASFDHFLVDGKISGHMTHLLGKAFFARRNAPTPVKLDNNDLKKELESALHKTCMEIHKFGNTHTMQIGTVSMEKDKIVDNIEAACKTLAEEYPGGWKNIRALQVKTALSLAIPIYKSFATKNSVKTPVVKPKRPSAYETVEGELTTIPGKTTVKMTPEGRVTVKRERDEEDHQIKEEVSKAPKEEEDEEIEEESEDEDEQ